MTILVSVCELVAVALFFSISLHFQTLILIGALVIILGWGIFKLISRRKENMKAAIAICGIALLTVGGFCFLWAAPKMDSLNSFGGQFMLAFSGSNSTGQVSQLQTTYYGSFIAMFVGGILLLAGFMIKPIARKEIN